MDYTKRQIKQVKDNRQQFYKLLGRYIKKQLTGRFCAYTSATLLEELRAGYHNDDKEIMKIINSYRHITKPFGYTMCCFFSYGDRYWNNVDRALETAGIAKVKYGNRWHFEFNARVEQRINVDGTGFVLRS